MFRVSRGLVMTTIDTVRCQPLWNQLFCQRVFVAGPPSPAWQNERNSNWTPIFELRTDIGAEQARDELNCGDALCGALVIRSVVTRCGHWPIRGQYYDTWPIRRGDTDHIWQLQPQLSALKKSWILSGPLSRCLVPDMLTITGRIWGLIIAGNNG